MNFIARIVFFKAVEKRPSLLLFFYLFYPCDNFSHFLQIHLFYANLR